MIRRTGNHRLAHHRGCRADYASQCPNLRDFRRVVLDALGLVDEDMRRRAENAILQLALQPRHQRQRHDQRHHANGDAERRDKGNDGDEDLAPFGQQIAERNLQLKRHG
jgi:hypothetical protein